MTPQAEPALRQLRRANTEARALLAGAAETLSAALHEESFMAETPLEVDAAMASAVEAIGAALRCLESAEAADRPFTVPPTGGPSRQQGQFLAFIREYTLRNSSGVAPRHVDFQRFFNLTPPSVNSMLIRLEAKGFIRRIAGKARAIELSVNPAWIPPLERPFKF